MFLTNNSFAFQNTITAFTGLSDSHKSVSTVLKTTFSTNKPKELLYRDYKKSNSSNFHDHLKDYFTINAAQSRHEFD